MPNRILREGILTSERVDSLASWASEVFYRRLISVVDDFGRYYANPSLLRAACYPLKLDKVSNADVEKWLAECAGAALVSTYEIDGKRYLQVLDFRQHQRAAASKFPQPPDGCNAHAPHVQRNRSTDAAPLRTYSETETESDANPESDAKAQSKSPARKVAARPVPRREEAPTSSTWASYSTAYRERWGVEPTRNARVNGQLAHFVSRVPAEEAPEIAAFYVRHNRGLYVAAKHAVDLMLRDAEGLRTEWLSGRAVTDTEARQADRTQANGNAFASLITEAEKRERQHAE